MTKFFRGLARAAALACALTITSSSVLTPAPAAAYVVSPSGASADTILVCQRLFGAYTFGTNNRGFHYVATLYYNTETGFSTWSSWATPESLNNRGFALPTRGQIAFYMYYIYWNGSQWEGVGEWAQVTNARGEVVGYFC